MLTVAINPYHLTLRELPAMAGLLLADRTVTVLPTPHTGDDRDDIKRAMFACPRYTRLLDTWRWASTLWRDGTISSLFDGQDAMTDVHGAMADMAASPACKPLHPFLHKELLKKPVEMLDRLSADMLKGGPDPGFCMPIAQGLDRFAARHSLVVTRAGRDAASGKSAASAGGGTASLVQRAEEMLGVTVFSVAVPVLASASGRTIDDLRADLEAELRPLREAIAKVATEATMRFAAATVGEVADGVKAAAEAQAAQRRIRDAAAVYSQAFEDVIGGVLNHDDDRGIRITAATCRMVCRVLPADAVVRSSVAALRTARRVGLLRAEGEEADSDQDGAEVAKPVTTLVISAMPR